MSEQKELSVTLEEIEERANKATEGAWGLNYGDVLANGITARVCQVPQDEDFQAAKWQNNREFIKAARTDVPRLVKALRELWEAYSDKSSHIAPHVIAHANKRLTAILNGEEEKQDSK